MKLATAKFLPVLISVLLLALGTYMTGIANLPFDNEPVFTFKGFDPANSGLTPSGRTKTATPRIVIGMSPASHPPGKVHVSISGFSEQTISVDRDSNEFAFSLANLVPQTQYSLSFAWHPNGEDNRANSLTIPIIYDNSGPMLIGPVIHESTPDNFSRLAMTFDDNLKRGVEVTATEISLFRETTSNLFESRINYSEKAIVNGNNATLSIPALAIGRYKLVVNATLKNDLDLAAIQQDRVFFVPPLPLADGAPLKITGEGMILRPSGFLTNSAKIKVRISGRPLPPGSLIPIANGGFQTAVAYPGASDIVEVELTNEGQNTVAVSFTDSYNRTVTSNTIEVKLDRKGPILKHAELIESPSATGTSTILLATFDDDDLGSLKKEQFAISRQLANGVFDPSPMNHVAEPTVDGKIVRLHVGSLVAGEYQLVVKGTDATNSLRDLAQNAAGNRTDQTWVFSSLADRKFGSHVEFTPFVPPKKQSIPEEGFNPGDFVETRVARLYYYRDAHRVAEIINRNIRSYNQAAVTQAERRAEKSRDDADDATDGRRKSERDAVRAAEQARNAEQKLFAARETLGQALEIQNTIADDKAKAQSLAQSQAANPAVPVDPNLKASLEKRIAENEANLAKFGGKPAVDALAKNVISMEQSVGSLRQTELVKQENATDADAKEAQARAKQFRDEVSAAKADPDTYVAGDIHSADPVTQVSISVIGEGLIQLRGPIKGINKIRTMINEIDSPVGQIKIGIFTVQVNGEKGDKMEKVIGDAESNIDLSRFLVNQSLNLLRRSIQSEAALIAEQCNAEAGHYQVDRDRRYLYGFFGRDFIDELYAMNSEFLNTENKLLSLHAMDTVSLNRALFILALARNDVRARIVNRFLESSKTELADAEYDFRRSSELKPHRTQKAFPPWNRTHLPASNKYTKEDIIFEAVHRNAEQRYHFRNFNGFFDTGFLNPDTMNPMQREFIRLAQIFKARLIAEMELKQRVIERGLIEDRSNDEDAFRKAISGAHQAALSNVGDAYFGLVTAETTIRQAAEAILNLEASFVDSQIDIGEFNTIKEKVKANRTKFNVIIEKVLESNQLQNFNISEIAKQKGNLASLASEVGVLSKKLSQWPWLTTSDRKKIEQKIASVNTGIQRLEAVTGVESDKEKDLGILLTADTYFPDPDALKKIYEDRINAWHRISDQIKTIRIVSLDNESSVRQLKQISEEILEALNKDFVGSKTADEVKTKLNSILSAASVDDRIARASYVLKRTRGNLDHRKMLNHLIDEQEEKFIELVEGTRSHIAVMDDYLKRLSIAIEDDFKVQFYDPAFVRVREAARLRAVNLGQIERTTILTNNRAFAKVDPQATMEFDLPKRQIAIKEAFDAAKALVEDTGALMNDPTFLSAFQMMGGSKQPATVKNLVPGQSTSTDQQNMGLVPRQQESGAPGSALQSLVPEPSIFKLETGTGFQIRPVMQPDGDSVVYDFDYMYTTNIREPVRADEKHIGRIKRHFVHTAVQTANFEMREISRYQVALKVSRTSQGVPLLQDIPFVGAAFRPAPSDESSIQQNIILGQTNVYPTLFDLMGLRWAQQVVDLDHASLLESEHVVRGRQKAIREFVFGESSKRVDEFLDVSSKAPNSYRPDFYYPQSPSSPHHPNGYVHPGELRDPTGNNFERFDRRPSEMQEPPYDRYKHQPVAPERIEPQAVPQSIPMNQAQPQSIPLRLGPVRTKIQSK